MSICCFVECPGGLDPFGIWFDRGLENYHCFWVEVLARVFACYTWMWHLRWLSFLTEIENNVFSQLRPTYCALRLLIGTSKMTHQTSALQKVSNLPQCLFKWQYSRNNHSCIFRSGVLISDIPLACDIFSIYSLGHSWGMAIFTTSLQAPKLCGDLPIIQLVHGNHTCYVCTYVCMYVCVCLWVYVCVCGEYWIHLQSDTHRLQF